VSRFRTGLMLFGFLGLAASAAPTSYSLSDCIDQALKANRTRAISQASERVAEAQLNQALSARWPEASLEVTGLRRDQDANFLFPSSTFSLGDMGTILAQALQIPASQLPGVTIPAQNVKLFDRDTLTSSLNVHVPLYTGGKVSALIKQGKAGLDAARAETHRTDLQIVQDVRRYYYGALLSRKLLAIGEEGVERLKVMTELTERLYQNGSGRVKKTDYLRTQVILASLKSLVSTLQSNEEMARTALANTMGLPWHASVAPVDQDIPTPAYGEPLDELVARAQNLNPQALQIGYGLSAAEAGVDKARSGHLPVVVLFGTADRYDNSYHAGLMTEQNRNSWTLGLRVQVPIFSGFRVQNEIREAQARKDRLGLERQQLMEGLGVQVKDAFLQIARSIQQTKSTGEALAAATESRELHERAYREELVDTKDVIEAQLTELFIRSQHQKARYDTQLHQSQLDNLIGQNLAANR